MFKLKNAQWDICQANRQTKIITIMYKKQDVKYTELYFVRNGKLVYAFEEQIGGNNDWIWNCRFGIVDEKEAEVLSSLGHGKTEDDNWNPNEIIKMYKKRMIQLRKKKRPVCTPAFVEKHIQEEMKRYGIERKLTTSPPCISVFRSIK